MKWLMVLLICGIGNSLWAQTPKQDPPYKKNPVLPELEIMQPDNSLLTRNQLKKQATLIMYFSPDCDHCIQQMDEMSKRMNDLKKLQVVMVTYQPMEQLVDFVKKYKLADHSNFKTGRDIKFQLPGFYQIKSLPYFALYDKDFKLITTFESNTKVDKILKAFKR